MFFRTADPAAPATPEKREEQQRMEKLLQRYNVRCQSTASFSSLPPDNGIVRNATLRGRRSSMIKKVSCPVAPVSSAIAGDMGCDKSPGACPPSHRFSSISATTSTSSTASDRSAESELVESWLRAIHFEEYVSHFLDAGYDLPTISRTTPEDLIAIGITNPLHRKQIKQEISSLSVSDGIPASVPESLFEWLYLLRLEEYEDVLRSQGYDSVDRVAQLTWEDFEDIGIRKLGHQKRLALANKRYASFVKEQSAAPSFTSSSSPYSSSSSGISSFSTSSSVTGSFPDLTRTSTHSFCPVTVMSETENGSLAHRAAHRGPAVYQKAKPVAMIAASRPASSASNTSFSEFVQDLKSKAGLGPSDLMSSASTCSLLSNTSFASDASHYSSGRHNYSTVSYDTSSIYATLKRNKRPPPPPPKRTNSVKSAAPNHSIGVYSENPAAGRFCDSRDSFFDAMQEQAFATCVKSLASKFSQIASIEDEDPHYGSFCDMKNVASSQRVYCESVDPFPPPPPPLHSAVMQGQDVRLTDSSEFPPPPTPLCQSAEDLRGGSAFASFSGNSAPSPDRSLSSSSNESLPFANDNIGTIRQSGSHQQHCNLHAVPRSTANLSAIDDLAASLLSSSQSPSSPVVLRRKIGASVSAAEHTGIKEKGTVIDDIESMLANLSNQLDAMLEQEVGQVTFS